MRYAWTLGMVMAAVLPAPSPALAGELWPAIPPEIGVGPPLARYGWVPYRCVDGPVNNFYDGAWYAGRPSALYRGYAYRPYYRYAAYRAVPRTYFCVEVER
jgi:hypothetical protein